MNKVVTKLKDIITKTNITSEVDQIDQLSNKSQPNQPPSPDSTLHGELSQFIKNFYKTNTSKIIEEQSKYILIIIIKLKKVIS